MTTYCSILWNGTNLLKLKLPNRFLKKSSLFAPFILLLATFFVGSAQSQSPGNPQGIRDWEGYFNNRSGNYSVWIDVHRSYLSGLGTPEAEKESKYLERVDGFWRSRLGKGFQGQQPCNTFEHDKALNYYASEAWCAPSLGNWEQIGPHLIMNASNIQVMFNGRVDAVRMNPSNQNEILIGTANSGIWKTVNGGVNWLNVTDNLNYPVLGADNFTVNPSNPLEILASGDLGKILKTTNGGSSWTVLQSFYELGDYRNVTHVMYDPNNSQHIYASTDWNMWYSSDNGLTWANLYHIPANSSDPLPPLITDVDKQIEKFIITSSGRLIVPLTVKWGAPTGLVAYTDDNGLTWHNGTAEGLFPNFSASASHIMGGVGISSEHNGKFIIGFDFDSLTASSFYSSEDGGLTFSAPRQVNTEGDIRGDKFFIEHSENSDHLLLGLVHPYKILTTNSAVNIENGFAFHDDVRDIQFLINSNGEEIYLFAHDGGLSKYNLTTGLMSSLNGLSLPIAESKGFGISQAESPQLMIGNQDGNTQWFHDIGFGWQWHKIGGGDGAYSGFNWDANKYYYSQNGAFTQIGYGFNFSNYQSGVLSSWLYNPVDISNDESWCIVGCAQIPQTNLDAGVRISRLIGSNSSYVLPNTIRITNVQIAPSNNDLILASDAKINAPGTGGMLFKSVNGGTTFTDKSNAPIFDENGISTPYLLKNILGWGTVISTIEIDPINANNIYIGLTGASYPPWATEIDTWKILKSTDAGDSWHVYTEGLPYLPVNDLEYMHFSNDLIFASTDIGVFYRDASMTEWKCMRVGMPSVIVKNLSIDYCGEKLYASTYGRAVWSTDIPESLLSTEPITVTGSMTLSANMYATRSIIVENGGFLTITGKLSMAPETFINVLEGGQLVIDGGLVTTLCGSAWYGIYAEGDPDGQSDTPGRVNVLNQGTVEHAATALNNFILTPSFDTDWNSTGGVIKCENAILLNNKRDVGFASYNAGSSGDQSYFKNTQFLTTNDYPYSYVKEHVTLYKVSKIPFLSCHFEDQRYNNLAPPYRRDGILTIDASYVIQKNCPPGTPDCSSAMQPSFVGLGDAVQSFGKSNITISRAHFHSHRAIHFDGVTFSTLVLNDFEVITYPQALGEQERPYGIFLERSRNYHVEGNDFTADAYGYGSMPIGAGVGVMVNNADGNNEKIYGNTFHGFGAGTVGLGQNRIANTFENGGLQIRCNTYTANFTDIFVRSLPGLTPLAKGIAKEQGSPTGGTGNLAGNLFSDNTVYPLVGKNYVNPTTSPNANVNVNPITYFMHDPQSDSRVQPTYPATSGVNPWPTISTYDEMNSCPSDLSQYLVAGDGLALKMEMQSAMHDQLAVLSQVVDAGDTYGMQTQVAMTSDADAWQKYLTLMEEAGYLSETVLKDIAAKEEGFSEAMIRDILYANPHAAKSKEIEETLDERADPLPEYMRLQIKTGLTKLSPKELIEILRDDYHYKRDMTIKQTVRGLLNDDATNHSASIMMLLSNTGDINFDYDLVEYYDSKAEYSLAEGLLNVMSSYELEGKQGEELFHFIEARNLLSTWSQAGKDMMSLSSEDLVTLSAYAERNDRSSSTARGILKLNGQEDEILAYVPSEDEKRLIWTTEEAQDKPNGHLEIYPNPAKDHFTVDYEVELVSDASMLLSIYDAQGHNLHSLVLTHPKNQLIVTWTPEVAGLYNIVITQGNTILKSSTLTMTKSR